MFNYMLDDKFYRPPLLLDLMESKVNYNKENKKGYRELADNFRSYMFDFYYPLSNKVNKKDFENQIINHFFMRRIGMQTFTAFRMRLENKMLEIMPYYNKLFDSFSDWDIFANGDTETETITDTKTFNENGTNSNINSNNSQTSTTANTSDISDRRYSKTPQNELDDVKDGKYITDYNFDTVTGADSSSSSGSSSGTSSGQNAKSGSETYTHTRNLTRVNNNEMELYTKYLEQKSKIMSLIYKDLECLFYGIEDLY